MFKLKIIENQLIFHYGGTVIIKDITEQQVSEIENLLSEGLDQDEFKNKLLDLVKEKEEPAVKKIIENNENVLFEKRQEVYIKDYNIKIPECFLGVIEGKLSENYINFLKLLSLNPIEAIRKKLPQYVIDNNLRITTNGYIVACRQVWKNKDSTVEADYYEKITSHSFKVKTKWKKAISNFFVDKEGNLHRKKIKGSTRLDLAVKATKKPVKENTYISNYYKQYGTKTLKPENWKVGDIMQLGSRSTGNVEKVCGSDMLHIRSNPKELSGFGDTNVLLLVNPQDVISCKEAWKFGVWKCYFAAIMDSTDISMFDKPMQNFENDFKDIEWKEIESTLLKKGKYTFSSEVLENDLSEEDYKKIILSRRVNALNEASNS